MTKKSPTYIAYGLLAVTCLAGWLLGADIVAQLASQPSPVPTTAPSDTRQWLAVNAAGTFHAREECAFVECGGKLFLLGGRGINPVDIFDPKTQTWTHGTPPPVEAHHFQPVVWRQRIYIACAMTGKFPREKPLDHILIYDPAKDAWSLGDAIPTDRRRGSAGAVIHHDKLYLVCGIINGHTDGWVNWTDSYDLQSGQWAKLPDAPRARDHFEAAIIDGKIYAAAGRRSSYVTHQLFDLTIPEIDVYDIAAKSWSTLPPAQNIPTQRAGAAALAVGSDLMIFGGESVAHKAAHSEVQALDTLSGKWRSLPAFLQGRHGTGVVLYDGAFYVCTGSGAIGGSPLLPSMEMLKSAEDGFTIGSLQYSDDFSKGLNNWSPELENGGTVSAVNGAMDIDVPAGCTVWFKPELTGPLMIEYQATAISAGGTNDRVSDLNCFWMARDTRSDKDIFAQPRSGKFSDYDRLLTYYASLGGNGNTTTRFRRYIGEQANRPLRPEHDLSAAEDLIAANHPQTIRLVACGSLIQYYRDGKKLFEMKDDKPYVKGWFGIRTTKNHMSVKNFRVYEVSPG